MGVGNPRRRPASHARLLATHKGPLFLGNVELDDSASEFLGQHEDRSFLRGWRQSTSVEHKASPISRYGKAS